MPTAGKLGKLPVNDKPKLQFSTLLRGVAPAPAIVDYISEVTDYPMDGNDKFGCCVWSETDHAYRAATKIASGTEKGFTLEQLLKGYSDVTGFNPNDPNTDQGTVIQDALNYWRKTGIGGDKIVAFAKVDHKNQAEVAAALYYLGHLSYGFNFPKVAMDQFNSGQAWDVVPDDGGIEGGHCVDVGYIDQSSGNMKCVTWAQVQNVTKAFFDKYADEAWVVLTQDWLDANGNTPVGENLNALGEEFAVLTGQPNPFPAPSPTPTPTPVPPTPDPVPPTPTPPPEPTPTPTPTPGPVSDADIAVARVIHRLVQQHYYHLLSGHQLRALEDWLMATGL